MRPLTTISRYVNSAFRAAGLAALVALSGSGCSNGSSTPPPPQGGTLEEKGINLTPDSSEVVTEMDEGGEEISYAKDKVLVQVAPDTKAADLESLLQQVQGQVTGHIQPLNWYEIQVQDAKTALPEIRQHPLVQNAELNYAGAVEELDIDAPGISGFAEGYHKIKLSEAYGFIGDKNLANVTVAVLDSGFDLEHPELASQFLPGVDVGSVDDNPTYEDVSENLSKARTHGTSVAGIIAMLNNGKDLNGVAYNAKILPVKVSASSALGKAAEGAAVNTVLAFKLAAGITYAALEGADVINMSLGWHSSSPSWLLQSAVEYAQAEGVSLVASAGNENKDGTNHYPSVLNGVISVGATTEDDKRWTYSESTGSNYSLNNNSKVLTVAAPGEDIWSAAAGERGELAITPGTGTSLAAPFVSGLEALVKSLKPSLSAEERQQIIIDSADEIKVAYPELDYPNVQGNKTWKRINAYNAVVLAETGCNPGKTFCNGGEHNVWLPMAMENAPTERSGHAAAWTGSEMIIWGGWNGGNAWEGSPLNNGGIYNPVTNSWRAMSNIGAPSARVVSAIWTGSEMIVWGGVDSSIEPLNDGGKYNPITNSWSTISTINAPIPREGYSMIWTGSEMIIWGGWDTVSPAYSAYSTVNTGGRYNPVTDVWLPTETMGAPSRRFAHTAVWTGTEMLIWGGLSANAINGELNSGGRYNPITNTWQAISSTGAPSTRYHPTAVWTGSEIIIWGGIDPPSGILNDGGKYNPITDSWSTMSTINAPTPRKDFSAIWTGFKYILWGGWREEEDFSDDGWRNNEYFVDGGRYEPGSDMWQSISAAQNTPTERGGHTTIWTGSEMIIWGGSVYNRKGDTDSLFLNTGARYRP